MSDEPPQEESSPPTSAQGRLAGQSAVVTGASSGIGRAVALAFAREGAKLLLTYRRNVEGAQQVADQIREAGGQASTTEVDISRETEVEALVAEAFARLSRVDVWVNNAGAEDRKSVV